MANSKDYSKLLPSQPPEGLVPWLLHNGELQQNFLIHKIAWGVHPVTGKKERMCQVTCSSCQKVSYANHVKEMPFSHDTFYDIETEKDLNSRCPHCGTGGVYIHSSEYSRYSRSAQSYPVTVHQVDGCLALCCWYVEKHFNKDGSYLIESFPFEAVVVEKRKMIRLNGWMGTLNARNKRFSGQWIQRVKFYDGIGLVDLVYPWDSSVLEGTYSENSKLDLFFQQNERTLPVPYLKLFPKHPTVENLVVQGAGYLVQELLEAEGRNYGGKWLCMEDIHWEEKRPAQMLGLNKGEFQQMVLEKWNPEQVMLYRIMKNHGYLLKPEQLQNCYKQLHTDGCRELLGIERNPVTVAKYLEKQKEKDTRNDYRILKDYWNMAELIELDLNNPDILFPSRLYPAHERVSALAKEVKIRINTEMMAARNKLLSKFVWEKDGILIRPAQSETELQEEGEKLHHCVSSYAKRMERGETAIFFIRRVESPHEPWFTLELDETELRVKQNRGNCNCARTEEIEIFEKAWLEYIQEIANKENKKASKKTKLKKRGKVA